MATKGVDKGEIYARIEKALQYMAQHKNCEDCENGGMMLICLRLNPVKLNVQRLLQLPEELIEDFSEAYNDYFWSLFHYTVKKHGKKFDPGFWKFRPHWFSCGKCEQCRLGLNSMKEADMMNGGMLSCADLIDKEGVRCYWPWSTPLEYRDDIRRGVRKLPCLQPIRQPWFRTRQ